MCVCVCVGRTKGGHGVDVFKMVVRSTRFTRPEMSAAGVT